MSEETTRDWYARYYKKKGHDRNDHLNPEVVFQNFATKKAVISALRRSRLDRTSARILDVGCGSGESLAVLASLGFAPERMAGIDILTERIAAAKRATPVMDLQAGDATALPWHSGTFDLVTESTMFVQLTDDSLAGVISAEMRRVLRPGGFLMLIDWRYADPRRREYLAVGSERIRALFPDLVHVGSFGGALVPPIGRPLSRFAPALYFAAQALMPFLSGMMVTLLRKPAIS